MERGGVKVLITILVILVIVAGGVLAYKITQSKKEETTVSNEDNILVGTAKEEKKCKYFKEMKDLLQ